jgi:predicted DNA-binding transcriptional regulator YafY
MEYMARYRDELTQRVVEPIGLYYYGSAWHLIAWCRVRNDYRDFRIDRISKLTPTSSTFFGHNHLSLQEYVQTVMRNHGDVHEAVVVFDKRTARFIGERKYQHGFVTETDLGDKVQMTFLTSFLPSLGRWLVAYGAGVDIVSPIELKEVIQGHVAELVEHYKPALASLESEKFS